MMLNTNKLPWTISPELSRIIQEGLTTAGITPDGGAILTFRDPDYSPEAGGFHPVEVAVESQGLIRYITDFAYVGRPPHCELAKELDFDFSLGLFQHFGVEYPITSGRETFKLWESNFLAYHRMGADSLAVEPME